MRVPSELDLHETQLERTRLSWQRTLVSVLAVAGIGALRDVVIGHPYFAIVAGIMAVIMAAPILQRSHSLHRRRAPKLTWQPIVVIFCIQVLAIGAVVALFNPR